MKLTVVMVIPNEYVERLREEQHAFLEVMNGETGRDVQEELMLLINSIPSMTDIVVAPERLGKPN